MKVTNYIILSMSSYRIFPDIQIVRLCGQNIIELTWFFFINNDGKICKTNFKCQFPTWCTNDLVISRNSSKKYPILTGIKTISSLKFHYVFNLISQDMLVREIFYLFFNSFLLVDLLG